MAASSRALPLSSSRACCPSVRLPASVPVSRCSGKIAGAGVGGIRAKAGAGEAEPEEKKKKKTGGGVQSLFNNVTEALDFSQVRSSEDAMLLEDAREATRSGGRMSREQVRNGKFLPLPLLSGSQIRRPLRKTSPTVCSCSMERSGGRSGAPTRISSSPMSKVGTLADDLSSCGCRNFSCSIIS